MSSFASTSRWNAESPARTCAGSPRRALEITAIVFAFIYSWPLALAYLVWKSFGYPVPPVVRELFDGNFSFGRKAAAHFAGPAWGFGGTGNLAFEEYRRAELARLEEERRRLDEESRAFTDFVTELKKAKDREEFDAFMAKRRAAGGSTAV